MRCFLLISISAFGYCAQHNANTLVVVSADGEWRAVIQTLKPDSRDIAHSPYGEWFVADSAIIANLKEPVIVFHGGWGKVDAAASTQWAISRWRPSLIVNLGTAGGFPGRAREGDVIFATRTLIYDIVERMGDPTGAIRAYTTEIGPTFRKSHLWKSRGL